MKALRGILGLAAAAAANGASAADWDSVAGWDVHEIDRSRCVVGRTFADPGATIVGLILSVDGEARIFASSPTWKTSAGAGVTASVALDDRTLIESGFVGVAERGRAGFVAAAPAAFLDSFASANALRLSAGADGAARSLPLTGSGAGIAQLRRCVANLREEGPDVAPPPRFAEASSQPAPQAARPAQRAPLRNAATPVVASRAVPKKSRASWVEAEDYPAAALRAEEEGQVTVKLAIAPTGDVAGCDVIKSSGSRALDGTTCRIIQRRAKYRPATDAIGRPVQGFDQHTVRWTLPQ